jgi:SAM-dependent methyltransferase
VTGAPRSQAEAGRPPGGQLLAAFAETPRLNRWLYSKLAAHVRGDVLEIGSGIGNLSRFIVGAARSVVLSDLEPHCLRTLARGFAGDPRVTVVRYDLDAAPPAELAARRFDTVVAVNVIEHVADDQALARALAGLLRPGGKLVVYVPACPFAYGALDGALGHFRRYTPAGLEALLVGAGLAPAPPAYMNLLGLLGWVLNGRLLRRRHLARRQIALFERLLPLLRLEDHFRLPLGLGLYTAAVKRA